MPFLQLSLGQVRGSAGHVLLLGAVLVALRLLLRGTLAPVGLVLLEEPRPGVGDLQLAEVVDRDLAHRVVARGTLSEIRAKLNVIIKHVNKK